MEVLGLSPDVLGHKHSFDAPRSSDFHLQGRANDTVIRFREAVEKRERALQRAVDAGVASAIAKAQGELDGAKAMLAVAEQSSQKLK